MHNLDFTLDQATSILHLRATSALSVEDFAALAKVVDSHIEATGGLQGIMIETPSFPGWESLRATLAHFRFVRDHHRQVKKVAIITDSGIGAIAENLASHFVAAKIRHFPSSEPEQAKAWILEPS
jgi:hypothetical protein